MPQSSRRWLKDRATPGRHWRSGLPGGVYWPLAHAEHVAVGVLEPRTPSRTDLMRSGSRAT